MSKERKAFCMHYNVKRRNEEEGGDLMRSVVFCNCINIEGKVNCRDHTEGRHVQGNEDNNEHRLTIDDLRSKCMRGFTQIAKFSECHSRMF